MPVQPINYRRFTYVGSLLILCVMLAGQIAFAMSPNQQDYFQGGSVPEWPVLLPVALWLILSIAALAALVVVLLRPLKMKVSLRIWLCVPPILVCFAGFAVAFIEMTEYYSVR